MLYLPVPIIQELRQVDFDNLALRIHEIRKHQEKLQTKKVQIESFLCDRRVQLASPEIVKSYVNDLRNLLNKSSPSKRRAFIRSFLREVKVTRDEVSLTYTMPLSPTSVSEEKAGVLPTVQYGGSKCTIDRTFSLTFSLDQ